jgi:hypothetical protein
MAWGANIKKAVYLGNCTHRTSGEQVSYDSPAADALDGSLWRAGAEPRDITEQLSNAATLSQENGASANSIDCYGSFKCPTNSHYLGSSEWWDSSLGPQRCKNQYQYIVGQCTNEKYFKSTWGNPVDISNCLTPVTTPSTPTSTPSTPTSTQSTLTSTPPPPEKKSQPRWMMYAVIGGALAIVLLLLASSSPQHKQAAAPAAG